MQYVANSFIHSTTCQSQALYLISKSKSSSSREIFDRKFPIYCIGVKEGKNKKWKKKAKIKISILIFLYTIYFTTLKAHTKFEDPGSNRS